MAKLGVDRRVEIAAFQRVVDIDTQAGHKNDRANYFQRMAIAHWLVGNPDLADDCLEVAKEKISKHRLRTEFSFWRYRTVSPRVFLGDLQEISEQFANGAELRPRFLAATTDF